MDPQKDQKAAGFARNPGSRNLGILGSLMCWDAVYFCAKEAGIINPFRFNQLKQSTQEGILYRSRFSVDSRSQLISLPPGMFLCFLAENRVIHAMLSMGNGWAAGNKNLCIGIGNPGGWEIIDLGKLTWEGSTLKAKNESGSSRAIRLKYFPISDLS